MNYEDLLAALEEDDDGVMMRHLLDNVVVPCLDGHPNCDVEYFINDVLDVGSGFVKPNLLQVYSFVVVRMSETSYEVHVRAQCIDTLSGAADGEFAKTRVVVAVDGEVSPQASVFDAGVYTNPIEVV